VSRKTAFNLALYLVAMVVILGLLAWGKPSKVLGLFFVSGLAVGSLYALGGIGLVVLYRATGVLNFANGAAGAAGAMTAWQLGQWNVWPPATWLACIVVALIISLTYGRLIAPHLAWREPIVKAVATLGFALIILGLVSFIWIDDPRSLSLPTDKMAVQILGLRVTVTRLIVIATSVALVIGIWAFLKYTPIGLHMRSLANDRDLSALIGVPIIRVETFAWGLSGVIAGFTGLMFGDLIRLEPTVITFMVIPSVAAAICGRLEYLSLVLVGGLSIGVIESMLTLSPIFKSVRPLAPFVIAAIVLLWYQRGQRLTFGGGD
jgi:branched-chain amino acid transport system permease protein